MATSYEAIATVTVGSGGASSMVFTSIPATYTDLLILLSGRSTYTGDTYRFGTIQFNDLTTNQTSRYLYGDGSTVASANDTSIYYWLNGNSSTSSTFSNISIYITNYASSNNKSVSIDSITEHNGTQAFAALLAGLWSSSSAITKIGLFPAGGNFMQYSTATLYGIKNTV